MNKKEAEKIATIGAKLENLRKTSKHAEIRDAARRAAGLIDAATVIMFIRDHKQAEAGEVMTTSTTAGL